MKTISVQMRAAMDKLSKIPKTMKVADAEIVKTIRGAINVSQELYILTDSMLDVMNSSTGNLRVDTAKVMRGGTVVEDSIRAAKAGLEAIEKLINDRSFPDIR